MTTWLMEELANDRLDRLRAEAAAYRRLPRRHDRAARPMARRLAAAVRVTALRRPGVVGCEA